MIRPILPVGLRGCIGSLVITGIVVYIFAY